MLYDHPAYYELAFSFRDVAAETAFLRQAMTTHSGIAVNRVLEIACGPAPHAGPLIASGLDYVGLDKNPAMIAHATDKWGQLPKRLTFVTADMASFRLTEPVEFAFVLLGSLYLNTEERIAGHFDSLAAALAVGGLYFLDLCLEYADPLKGRPERRVVTEHNGVKIDSRFDIELVDADRQLYEERWRLRIEKEGETREFETVEQNVAWYPDEFTRFIEARPDFELVGSWADWDFGSPIIPGVTPDRPFTLLRRI